MNSTLLRARGIFRFAFFAPVVVGEVAYSAVFRLLFNGNYGAMNGSLASFGLPTPDWLTQPWTAMAVVMIAVTWRWTGYNAIIILAGLQNIPQDLYEAAEVDGAPRWRQHLSITLPLLEAGDPLRARAVDHRHDAALRRALADHPRRPRQRHRDARHLPLPAGLHRMNFGYASAVAYAIALMAAIFSAITDHTFREAAVSDQPPPPRSDCMQPCSRWR